MNAVYLVALQSKSDRAIHDLRATLKFAGLRAVYAREIDPKHLQIVGARRAGVQANQRREIKTMDMRTFKKPHFLKVEDFRNGSRQMRIAGVLQGKYEKPDVVFESGDKLGLSATNLDILAAAYGWESDGWTGHVIELSVGKGEFGGKEVDMVLIKPISKAEGEEAAKEPAKKKAPNKPPQLAKSGGGMDDEIPFMPERR